MNQGLRKLGCIFLDLIYPEYCPGCGIRLFSQRDLPVCGSCLKLIRQLYAPFCPRCGTPSKTLVKSNRECGFCRGIEFAFDRAFSVCQYASITRTCIHLLKYERKTVLAGYLGGLMSGFLRNQVDLDDIDIIIPVPIHHNKMLERGFNQAALLAREIATRINRSYNEDLLRRKRKTVSQFRLTGIDRRLNIRGAFKANKSRLIAGKRVLLVDDIFTTGSTLSECARELKIAGAKSVTALTLAR